MGRIDPFCRERDFFQRCLRVKCTNSDHSYAHTLQRAFN